VTTTLQTQVADRRAARDSTVSCSRTAASHTRSPNPFEPAHLKGCSGTGL